jgi:hypothetical protein
VVVASGICAALAAPAAAHGTVTIGSNLGRAPNVILSCGANCTAAQASLPSDRLAPGGLLSPVNGMVVLWRVRAPASPDPIVFRVVRSLGSGLSTGAGTSGTVTPAASSISSFPAQLPIAIGDRIGLDCCSGGGAGDAYFVNSGGPRDSWEPVLADGGLGRAPDNVFQNREVLLNADVDPLSAFSILKAKSKPGGKVRITAQVPNPGLFAAGNKSAKVAGTAAGKKKTKYLKGIDTRVSAPGPAVLVVQSTKAARSVLADKGRLKAKLKLSFTPTGGAASTQVRKVKLKL